MKTHQKIKILFLCTGNSCRSQMAEGWCRYFHAERFEIYSAGIEKHGLNPRAVKVMQESGVDIRNQTSKTLDELGPILFDYVYTVCGHANELCPIFRGNAVVRHIGFDDPPKLSQALSDEEEILSLYRQVRDQIKNWIQYLE